MESLNAKQFLEELKLLRTAFPNDNSQFFRGEDASNKTLGIKMSEVFSLAKRFSKMPLDEIEKLLESEFYEARMGAVSIMDFQARDKKVSAESKKELYELYLGRHDRINNWDLVDRGAAYVVGGYLFNKDRQPLYELAKSENVWERRTAIVATYFFIRQNDITDTFKIAEILVHDKHDLINKAVGGWVREAGKRDKQKLIDFLNKFASTMPRITLRYAVEKLDAKEKEIYMNLRKKN